MLWILLKGLMSQATWFPTRPEALPPPCLSAGWGAFAKVGDHVINTPCGYLWCLPAGQGPAHIYQPLPSPLLGVSLFPFYLSTKVPPQPRSFLSIQYTSCDYLTKGRQISLYRVSTFLPEVMIPKGLSAKCLKGKMGKSNRQNTNYYSKVTFCCNNTSGNKYSIVPRWWQSHQDLYFSTWLYSMSLHLFLRAWDRVMQQPGHLSR